jgi:perosamine synthetase
MDFAARHRLLVIEDCAEAIGTRYKGRHVGTFGHVSTFSFFGNKTVTTGEGGMVVCNDDAVAAKISTLKGQGLSKDREYWHDVVGYNYRMTNICAAIGCAQMEAVDRIVETKQAIAAWYREGLEGLPVTMHATRNDTFHSYWMVSILTDRPADRDPLRAALKEAGIETRPLFNPIHLMPMHGQPRGRFPVAEDLAQRGINLPSYPDLTRQDVQAIWAETRAFFASRAR